MSNKEKVDKFLVEICQLILFLVYTLDITFGTLKKTVMLQYFQIFRSQVSTHSLTANI